jgi:hypothetical protein
VGWIPIGAWVLAALVTIVVLGYCGYELAWKAKRLRSDLGDVQADAAQLDGLRARLTAAQQRIGPTVGGATASGQR